MKKRYSTGSRAEVGILEFLSLSLSLFLAHIVSLTMHCLNLLDSSHRPSPSLTHFRVMFERSSSHDFHSAHSEGLNRSLPKNFELGLEKFISLSSWLVLICGSLSFQSCSKLTTQKECLYQAIVSLQWKRSLSCKFP